MKKPIYIAIASVLLAIAVAVNTIAVSPIFESSRSAETLSVKNSSSKTTFDFEKEGYNNSLDKLLKEDGFIYGIDYNYMGTNTNQYASLARNYILDIAPSFNEFTANIDVYNMKAMGFNAIGWWLLGHCEGVYFDEDGYATGLDETLLTNLRKLLDICRKYDMKMVPLLQTHGNASNYGNGSGKESAAQILHKYFKFYWDQTARDIYIEKVINPILDVFAEYQDVILIVSLLVENSSGMVNDADVGYHRTNTGTTWENWKKLVNDLHAASKAKLPNIPTTIEEGGPANDQSGTQENLYRENQLDVDFISHNFYTSHGNMMAHGAGLTTKPGIVGEYNGGGPGDGASASYWAGIKQKFMVTAKEGGWLGAFLFSYKAGGVDYQFMTGATTEYDTFHGWATSFRYAITDEINKHKGLTRDAVEQSIPLANKGGNEVYWVAGRGASTFELQRSDNGGTTWKTIAKDLSIDDYSIDNGFVRYTDETLTAGTKYCYRIVSFDDEGNSSVGPANNVEELFIPENILDNGGFENGLEGWSGTGGGQVSDEEPYNGSYSFKIDKANGIGGMSYGATSKFIDVKPNTVYKLTFKYKVTEAATGSGDGPYVQIQHPETGANLCFASYYGSAVTDTENDNGWRSSSLQFNSNDLTQIKIRLVTGSKPVFAAYLDDFELKEAR